jgi:hypothetical protein
MDDAKNLSNDKLIRPDSALCPWRLQEKKQLMDK